MNYFNPWAVPRKLIHVKCAPHLLSVLKQLLFFFSCLLLLVILWNDDLSRDLRLLVLKLDVFHC